MSPTDGDLRRNAQGKAEIYRDPRVSGSLTPHINDLMWSVLRDPKINFGNESVSDLL